MSQAFRDVVETVRRLRAPGGCPWDREQTHQSLRPYLMEESHEVLDVLDRLDSDELLKDPELARALKEELGDLWMQVLLHAEMAEEKGAFTIHDVAAALNEKLIRRHPHVFGETKVDGSDEVLKNWEKIKAQERAEKSAKPKGVLSGVPRGLPALLRCLRVIEKVTKAGFQWPDKSGPLAKLDEELAELKTEIRAFDAAETEPAREAARKRAEKELGDLLFNACNLAHHMKINPEDALRAMMGRFQARFEHVEARVGESGRPMDSHTLAELNALWDEAKRKGIGQ